MDESQTSREPGKDARRSDSARRWALALFAVMIAMTLLRVVATRTESINWDEFALFHNAAWSLESRELHGGGRPGLAVLLLLPFVSGCADEIEVVQRVRVLWLGFTFAALAGLGMLVAQIRPGSPDRWRDAALAMALFACVPTFVVWSLQVRTDQIAIAGALWGGVALVASRHRPHLAAIAGLLFGLGYLSSQKAAYIGALAGLLVLGDLWRARDTSFVREAQRGLIFVSSMGMVLVGFYALAPQLFDADPSAEVVSRSVASLAPEATTSAYRNQMSVFDYYRRTIGFRHYVEMLPLLIPHLALLGVMGWATWRRIRSAVDLDTNLLLAWCVLGLGMAICLFHAGAFPYFWMTLGIFPVVAIVLARESLEESLGHLSLPMRRGIGLLVWVALLVPGAIESAEILRDTQAVQRESFAFSHRNFDSEDAGFHAEAGFFCSAEPRRFPTYFSQYIDRLFGPAAECMTCAPRFIEKFVDEQVKYIVASYRMNQFPPLIREFWNAHYIPYRGAVLVAGKRFEGDADSQAFELVVDGDYLWLPSSPPVDIDIDGEAVVTGGRIRLERGRHTVRFPQGRDAAGILVLAMEEPPVGPFQRFYKVY